MPTPKAYLRAPALLILILPACSLAQTGIVVSAARAGIDAGNRAWIEGMKRGDAKLISATYSEDAVDCSAAGDCIKGRSAIERQLQDRILKLGHAVSASVTSKGSVQQGGFVYEWGEAEASFPNGSRVVGRYLTVWHIQIGHGWEIVRNMKIPPDKNP
jgi:ketosteroid isomerase-like protein